MLNEVVINNRNNVIAVKLLSDVAGTITVINPTTLTRCQVLVGTTLIDSAINPAFFDLSLTDRLILKLGSANLPVGKYTAKLYVFDSQNILGIEFLKFKIVVRI